MSTQVVNEGYKEGRLFLLKPYKPSYIPSFYNHCVNISLHDYLEGDLFNSVFLVLSPSIINVKTCTRRCDTRCKEKKEVKEVVMVEGVRKTLSFFNLTTFFYLSYPYFHPFKSFE